MLCWRMRTPKPTQVTGKDCFPDGTLYDRAMTNVLCISCSQRALSCSFIVVLGSAGLGLSSRLCYLAEHVLLRLTSIHSVPGACLALCCTFCSRISLPGHLSRKGQRARQLVTKRYASCPIPGSCPLTGLPWHPYQDTFPNLGYINVVRDVHALECNDQYL